MTGVQTCALPISSQETIENRFRFNGQQYDPVSQQYYLRARYYNPVIGRFTQEDTYRGDGLNLYAYCRNNPVYYVDPSGNICEKRANILMENVRKGNELTRKEKRQLGAHLRDKERKVGLSDSEKKILNQVDRKRKQTGESGRYTKTNYEGTTKVGGQEKDISRTVYQRNDIDWNRVDPTTGLTNKQLAQAGLAPYANDGTKMELHHLLQQEPGPMVEIPGSLHDKYYKALHGLVGDGESFRNNPDLEKQYNNFRSKYWRRRAKNL